jgi:hypothetical protein
MSCSNKTRIRVFLIVLTAVILTGCSQDEKLAACQVNADRFFPTFKPTDSDDPRSQYIIECMAANGYDLDVVPKDCDNNRPFAIQAACYRRDSWFNDLFDKIRRADR